MHGHGCSLEVFSAFIYSLQDVLVQDNQQKLGTGLGSRSQWSLRINTPSNEDWWRWSPACPGVPKTKSLWCFAGLNLELMGFCLFLRGRKAVRLTFTSLAGTLFSWRAHNCFMGVSLDFATLSSSWCRYLIMMIELIDVLACPSLTNWLSWIIERSDLC